MKSFKLILVILLFTTNWNCNSQISGNRIEIVPPTIQQEATSIWRTINDITFLEKQGYKINLPKDKIIDSLLIKSKNGTFGNNDFQTIYNLLESNFFYKENYKKATQKVKNQFHLINKLINKIDISKSNWGWNFKTYKTYKIILTLYGTGGSYDAESGTITLLTNKKGDFMRYKNPANTIIHEITHIGIEHSIVQKHQLQHNVKEKNVDTFVHLFFNDELPEYKIQNMGETSLDKYFSKKEDFKNLDKIIFKLKK